MTQLRIENFTKEINGKLILDNINIEFNSNYIYGLHGINGSGKTMLLRAISGLIYPDKGKITIDGEVLHKDISFPPSIGIVIENTSLLESYDARTNLKMLSRIKKAVGDNEIKDALRRVGLDDNSKLKVKKFSLGMKQRLSIAQAIFEKPDLILLDEPTNALDTEGIELVRNLLREEKERGALIILTSHNLEDIRILADYEIKMNEGKIMKYEKK